MYSCNESLAQHSPSLEFCDSADKPAFHVKGAIQFSFHSVTLHR